MSRIHQALSKLGQENPARPLDAPGSLGLRNLLEGGASALDQVARSTASPPENLVSLNGDRSIGQERFRLLSHRLRRMREIQPLTRLLVTSSIPREGKTLVSVNLACVLRRGSAKVLLVDADLRQPGANRVLNLPSTPGLAELLEGQKEITESLRIVDPLGFYFLPAGQTTTNPVELLQSPRMRQLMQEASTVFDWVVVDSPPVNPFADAQCISAWCDGVLLVVRSGYTPSAAFDQTTEALRGANILGVLLNACDFTEQNYYYSYYPKS